jgi:hypothetical protein
MKSSRDIEAGDSFIALRLFVQQRNVLSFRRHRNRFQICVNVGQVLIRKSLGGVWRHLVRGLANVTLKTFKGKLRGADASGASLRGSLALAAVALVAAIAHEELFSVFRISGWWSVGSLLRPRTRIAEQRSREKEK